MAQSLDLLFHTLDQLESKDLKRFRTYLSERTMEGCEPIPRGKLEHGDATDVASKMKEAYGVKSSVKLTLTILKKMNLNDLADKLQRAADSGKDDGIDKKRPKEEKEEKNIPQQQECDAEGQTKSKKQKASLKLQLQTNLKDRFSKVYQEFGCSSLQDTYADLHIVEGFTGGVSSTHEVSAINMGQIGTRTSSEDEQVRLDELFKKGRKVLTLGIAGVGKTIAVQKFVTDWAEQKTNQDIDFVFVFLFRELNLKRSENCSLLDLLLLFYPELTDLKFFPDFRKCKILFVFDGLDESRLQLTFSRWIFNTCLEDESSVDVLVTSLIACKLLPSALIWVTTRPAAASLIPRETFDLFTEVRGFNNHQKIEFFQKNIKTPEKAKKVIDYVHSNKSLHIMCHIPMFCRILAIVLNKILGDQSKGKPPKTVTEIYTLFSTFQIGRMDEKFSKKLSAEEKGQLLVKFGKLAFEHLEKGTLVFYEKDLAKCNIDVDSEILQAGICTEIFNVETAVAGEKVFSFLHLSLQEFLAALYVLHSHATNKINLLSKTLSEKTGWFFKKTRFDLYKDAVNKALQSQNGHLDLFVRFLLGLAPMLEPKIQPPLDVMLPQLSVKTESTQETVRYIKHKIMMDTSPERLINLFHCLNELGDNSLVEEINSYMSSAVKETHLTPGQCSALAYLLLMSAEDLEEFDLKKYLRSEEGLHRMIPVVKISRRVWLNECHLSKSSCERMSSILQEPSSHLRELDMSANDLQDEGVKLLCAGLKNPQCKLEILRLGACQLTHESCKIAALILQSENSLKELDLSDNDLGDSGVKLLAEGLSSAHCKLQTLRLEACQLTHESCKTVALILQSVNSLKELDLSDSDLGDSGVQLLVEGLSSPHCNLQTLRLARNRISNGDYVCLALTLMLNPSCVKELDVSNNHSGESAQKLLFATLKDPHRQVKDIQLADCKLSDKSCEMMARVLQSANSLVKLDLSSIDLRDSGVQLLSPGLSSPHCKLQTLRLAECTLKHASCEIVASVLQSPNSLLHLDLSDNDLGDSGVQLLSKGLSDPNCKLQILRLSGCLISENGYTCLASALISNPSHLKELDLSYNHPGESGLKLLSARLKDPVCKLETLKTDHASRIGRLLRYVCELTLDPNTANRDLCLSEGNRKVTCVSEWQRYPAHPERFDYWPQVLCREGLSGRCYWEAEWSSDGTVVAVAYKSMQRKGINYDSWFGNNDKSWRLHCFGNSYSARHNKEQTPIPAPSSHSSRVGVYLDWPAGTLSFYSVSSDTLTHLHTFHSTFTEPLYPGFRVLYDHSSVTLCQIT